MFVHKNAGLDIHSPSKNAGVEKGVSGFNWFLVDLWVSIAVSFFFGVFLSNMYLKYTWTTFKTLLTLHRIGWFREILVSAYCITIPILPGSIIPSIQQITRVWSLHKCTWIFWLEPWFPILAPEIEGISLPIRYLFGDPKLVWGRDDSFFTRYHHIIHGTGISTHSSSWWNPTMFSSSIAPAGAYRIPASLSKLPNITRVNPQQLHVKFSWREDTKIVRNLKSSK